MHKLVMAVSAAARGSVEVTERTLYSSRIIAGETRCVVPRSLGRTERRMSTRGGAKAGVGRETGRDRSRTRPHFCYEVGTMEHVALEPATASFPLSLLTLSVPVSGLD